MLSSLNPLIIEFTYRRTGSDLQRPPSQGLRGREKEHYTGGALAARSRRPREIECHRVFFGGGVDAC